MTPIYTTESGQYVFKYVLNHTVTIHYSGIRDFPEYECVVLLDETGCGIIGVNRKDFFKGEQYDNIQ